jgi:hypothetical protein
VVIEKFIDFIFFVVLFFIIALSSTTVIEDMLLVSSIVITTMGTGLFIFVRFNQTLLRVIAILMPESVFVRIEALNSELLAGIYLFKSVRQIVSSLILFLCGWSCIAVIFYLVSWPFLETLQLPFYAPVVLMVFSALSLAIPSAPAAIGTMHFAFLIAIKLMIGGELDIDLVAGFIVALHFFVILFDFIVGALLMGMYKIRSAPAFQQD